MTNPHPSKPETEMDRLLSSLLRASSDGRKVEIVTRDRDILITLNDGPIITTGVVSRIAAGEVPIAIAYMLDTLTGRLTGHGR